MAPPYPAVPVRPQGNARARPGGRRGRCAVEVAIPVAGDPAPEVTPAGDLTAARLQTLAADRIGRRFWRRLMDRAVGHHNDHAFACMIGTLAGGGGALPDWLGLEPAAFRCLLDYHFPGADLDAVMAVGRPLRAGRLDEREELLQLLLMDRANESPSEVWMAHVVAAGCMGSNHLWEDLGLWERPELTALMRRNFPALAARNVRDMKWKRFLYKQLCEAEGIYTCRSPSCEVCKDYHECFAAGP